jgi:hypothetical protein
MSLPRSAFCLSLALLSGAAFAQGAPGVREGMAYSEARGVLLAKGYRPVSAGEQDESRCSAGRQDVCAAYPETISCAGTGAASCHFIFSAPNGAALTVIADGKNAGRLRVTAVRKSSREDADWQRSRR